MCQVEGDRGLCAGPPIWHWASWQPGLKGKHLSLMEFSLPAPTPKIWNAFSFLVIFFLTQTKKLLSFEAYMGQRMWTLLKEVCKLFSSPEE